jgi:hypothetical protein
VKYSRDGCLLSSNIAVITDVAESYFDVAFRGMAMGTFDGEEALYVADSSPHNARVVVFGECDSKGMRSSKAVIVDSVKTPGIMHTEGITLDQNGDVYISNRYRDAVLRFAHTSFAPMPFPPELNAQEGVVYFGAPALHSDTDNAVRAVMHAGGKICVASQELRGGRFVRYCDWGGKRFDYFERDDCYASQYKSSCNIFSCKSRETGPIVYGTSTDTLAIVHTISRLQNFSDSVSPSKIYRIKPLLILQISSKMVGKGVKIGKGVLILHFLPGSWDLLLVPFPIHEWCGRLQRGQRDPRCIHWTMSKRNRRQERLP